MIERVAWREKYRPQSFSEVVGQKSVVDRLRARVSTRRGRNLILAGPTGTGKTTLARVFSKAAMCREPLASVEACGACDSCKSWAQDYNPDFVEINCGLDGKLDTVADLQGTLGYQPLHGRARVIFFDEAHRMSRQAQDALLPLLENSADWNVFIFSLIDEGQILRPLRDRSRELHLNAPSLEERMDYLRRIARGEQLGSEAGAFELLCRYRSSFRALAEGMEMVADEAAGRPISKADVRGVLGRDGLSAMTDYLLAACEGDLDRQYGAVRVSAASAPDKLILIQQILHHLKLYYIGPFAGGTQSPIDGLLDDVACQHIVGALEERATWLSVSLMAFFDQILEFWSFWPREFGDADFEIQIARFHDRMTVADGDAHGPSSLLPKSSGSLRQSAPFPEHRRKFRIQSQPGVSSRSAYLTAGQAAQIYEAATFLIQRFGLTFNARITLAYRPDAIDVVTKAFVTGFLRELGQNFGRWARAAELPEGEAALHYIAVHERAEGAGSATIIFHLPERIKGRVRRWLEMQRSSREAASALLPSACALDAELSRKSAGKVDAHWHMVRWLWRGLDPHVLANGAPLIDRLQVPVRSRRPAGAVSGRRFASSRSLSLSSQMSAVREYGPHFSALADGQWDQLFSRWEIEAAELRSAALAAHMKRLREIERELESPGDSMARQILVSEREMLHLDWEKSKEIRQKPWIS